MDSYDMEWHSALQHWMTLARRSIFTFARLSSFCTDGMGSPSVVHIVLNIIHTSSLSLNKILFEACLLKYKGQVKYTKLWSFSNIYHSNMRQWLSVVTKEQMYNVVCRLNVTRMLYKKMGYCPSYNVRETLGVKLKNIKKLVLFIFRPDYA